MYTIELTANGNEVTVYHEVTSCGDFAGCHDEPRTCACED